MALTIKNAEVERLAAEVASMTGETKTQAIRVALEERRRRLTASTGIDPEARKAEIWRWLETEVWPLVPEELRGKPHDSRDDDAIIGYGPDGLPE